MAIIKKKSRAAIKEVINKNFTFADLSPRFKNVDSSTGNIFCPFHDNHSTPAAKMYWDDERGIWIIHCFGQCHRNFTAYDYVDLILCERYQKYGSPLEFLRNNMDPVDLEMQLDIYESQIRDDSESTFQAKAEYIDTVAAENESLEDYIEALYLG